MLSDLIISLGAGLKDPKAGDVDVKKKKAISLKDQFKFMER